MDFEQADALNEVVRSIGMRHRELATRALAPFGIHPGHKLVLFELAATGPTTQARLAEACGYEPPTITLSVRQLADLGLVERRPSPTDKRATVVELTPAGRALLPKIKAAWRKVATEAVAGLAATDVATLTAVLGDFARSLERHEDLAGVGPRSRSR